MNRYCAILFGLLLSYNVFSQQTDSTLQRIFNEELSNGKSYQMLKYLSTKIGHRLSGSPQAAAAVEYTRQRMVELDFDTVYLQPVMVPHWVRGDVEKASIVSTPQQGTVDVKICALGNAVGTGPGGIVAEVIEVQSLEQLAELGKKKIDGKIVFFNRPMDPTHYRTFKAYGGAVDQRVHGASEAAKYGAVGVVVRSMTLSLDDVPHTGTLRYKEGLPKIPAVAISTIGAEELSKAIMQNDGQKFYFETHSQMLPDVLSYNVIGELKGSTFPNEYIVIGGHLDSWDFGDGSHDDGAGCIQSIEVLRLFKTLGIQPKRTLRAVMFMNEENGLRGGLKYAALAAASKEKHLLAMESDAGAFTPQGFNVNGTDDVLMKIKEMAKSLEPYGVYQIVRGGGGADIGPLKDQGVTLIGLMPDSQRYFDYHHTAEDTFDKVNKRELELGAASMAAMIYMIDNDGL